MENHTNLLRGLATLLRDLWSREAGNPAGRRNLGLCLLLLIACAIGFVPSIVERLLSCLLNKASPTWTPAIPLVSFIVLAIFFYLSLRTIPPKPHR